MYQFVESIQLKDGHFKRLDLHQKRLQNAMAKFYPTEKSIDLAESLAKNSIPTEGLFKCRVLYDSNIRKIEFSPYIRRDINSLKIVETEIESHEYKLENRKEYNSAFAQRGDCDDILLVKNGLLTDTSYCNIALYDGKNWFTPRIPLIFGVNRADLIDNQLLIEKDIKISDLKNYTQISLFNAMIEFKELALNIRSIYT